MASNEGSKEITATGPVRELQTDAVQLAAAIVLCQAAVVLGDASTKQNTAGVVGFGNTCPGVCGRGTNGDGVWGTSQGANGVLGTSTSGTGVQGNSTSGAGVKGSSTQSDGVVGSSSANGHAGISAVNTNPGNSAYGLWAKGAPAGHFEGNVEVTGDITLLNQDCAEDFDVCGSAILDAGTVVVLTERGAVEQCGRGYDKRAAGVVSGAGAFKPAIVLGRLDSSKDRIPIALVGKVYCKVDARYAAIEVGDLLTTSPTPGYAMKAKEPGKSFGAVIGKALAALEVGQDLIPILVALQ